ncbi:MAG: sigma-70 family RNA polymerase sigma factor [Erysipelotrichales bacterium]|nr:sigma-70 family RNA polymerase sigma factor [Erysipelotrichales bacterium]
MKRKISDEEYLYLIRQGNETAVEEFMARYRRYVVPMVLSLLRSYAYADIREAGHLAIASLTRAMENYRPDRTASFRPFAVLCAEREVHSYIRHESSKGIFTPGRMVSLDRSVSSAFDCPASEAIGNRTPEFEPAWVFRFNEMKQQAQKALEELPDSERVIYRMWRDNVSYKEIGRKTGKSVKEVDLCLQRAKSHLKARVDYRN